MHVICSDSRLTTAVKIFYQISYRPCHAFLPLPSLTNSMQHHFQSALSTSTWTLLSTLKSEAPDPLCLQHVQLYSCLMKAALQLLHHSSKLRTACDSKHLAADIAGLFVVSEEHERRRHFLWLCRPSHRIRLAKLLNLHTAPQTPVHDPNQQAHLPYDIFHLAIE